MEYWNEMVEWNTELFWACIPDRNNYIHQFAKNYSCGEVFHSHNKFARLLYFPSLQGIYTCTKCIMRIHICVCYIWQVK